jgi:hypothetical protein
MAFGQQSGPPASPKQLAYLKSLLQAAGHDDFRTARHEFGLTQRQAGGKFTTREASALIDRLTGVEPTEPGEAPDLSAPQREELADSRRALLRGIPADLLADELARRGWAVIPPT